MGGPKGQPHRGGKKNRKHLRNYRWGGELHKITKYRARHGIDPGKKRGKQGNDGRG